MGAMISDSGRAFRDEVEAKEVIDIVSSLFGGLGGYVIGLKSRGSSMTGVANVAGAPLCTYDASSSSAPASELSTKAFDSLRDSESELCVVNE